MLPHHRTNAFVAPSQVPCGVRVGPAHQRQRWPWRAATTHDAPADMSARHKAAAAAVAATFAGDGDPLVVTMLATAAAMERTAAVQYLRAILRCVSSSSCACLRPLSRLPSLHSDKQSHALLDTCRKFELARAGAEEAGDGDGGASTGSGRKRQRLASGDSPPPWLTTEVAPADTADALTAELEGFEAWASLAPAELDARQLLVAQVTHLVHKSLGTDVLVRPFGSLAAGTAVFESDIDIALHAREADDVGARQGPGVRDLRQVAHSLQRCGWAEDVEFRSRAKVPIINFRHIATGVSVDVGGASGKADGELTTQAVRAMVSEWPRLFSPLLLFLKTALGAADLNKPFTGGLGSFKLSALLALFLSRLERRHGGPGHMPSSGACLSAFLGFLAHQFDFEEGCVDIMGVRADFQSVFSWRSVAGWAQAALQKLHQPATPGQHHSRLARLVDVAHLSAARARSLAMARVVAEEAHALLGAPATAPPQPPPMRLEQAPPLPAAPTSLHVFDLDGTLLQTFGPQEGRAALRLLGLEWPHKSWWHHPGSLQPPLPVRPGPALAAYAAAAAEPDSLLAIMSGRRLGLLPVVHQTLAAAGAPHAPHVEFYAADEDSEREDTMQVKSRALQTLLARYGAGTQLAAVHVWEDRAAHAAELRSVCAAGCGAHTRWEVHVVGPEGPARAQPAAAPSPLRTEPVDGGNAYMVASDSSSRSERSSSSD